MLQMQQDPNYIPINSTNITLLPSPLTTLTLKPVSSGNMPHDCVHNRVGTVLQHTQL